jgi:hypothetical protein
MLESSIFIISKSFDLAKQFFKKSYFFALLFFSLSFEKFQLIGSLLSSIIVHLESLSNQGLR